LTSVETREPVAVVGASSAGLFAAYLLARNHVPVRLYERTEELAPKPRTLIVTPELQRVLGFAPVTATVNKVHTLQLCTDTRQVSIELQEPDLIVERAELVRLLARRAEQSGVQIVGGQNFEGLERTGINTVLHFRQRGSDRTQQVTASAVIAADGGRSQVARSLGDHPQQMVTVIQARVSLPAPADPGIGKVWFLPRQTPFFFWLCPESADLAAVGIVDACRSTARAKLDAFLSERNMQPIEYQGAMVPLYRPNPSPARKIGGMPVLLVGDAAGQVKVTTVGGTVTGLLGAQAAAQSIIKDSDYARELRGVDRELRLHWWLRALMSRLRDHEYDALLHMLSGKAARLLEIHNRDQLLRGVWPIMAAQPRLSILAAQVLWRGWPEA